MTNKFNFIINQNEVKKVHYQHFVKTWVKSYWYDHICMATVHKKAIDSNWLSATQTLKGKAIIRIKKKLFDTTTIRVIIGFDLRGLVKEFDLLNVLIRVSMEFNFWIFEPLRVKCSKLGYFFSLHFEVVIATRYFIFTLLSHSDSLLCQKNTSHISCH